MKDISALLSSKELAACPSSTFKVQVNWNLLVEIIVHRAHSGLIEIAAEMLKWGQQREALSPKANSMRR